MTSHEPRIEWRLSTSLQGMLPRTDFYDLFIDDRYEYTWVTLNKTTGKWTLNDSAGQHGPEVDTMDEAKALLLARRVVQILEG